MPKEVKLSDVINWLRENLDLTWSRHTLLNRKEGEPHPPWPGPIKYLNITVDTRDMKVFRIVANPGCQGEVECDFRGDKWLADPVRNEIDKSDKTILDDLKEKVTRKDDKTS